jgi:hypothetical protein
MKRYMLACVGLLASLVSTISFAQAVDFDGGVAFATDGKIVYQEFRSGKTTVLVNEGFSEFGVGQDGTTVYVAVERNYGYVSTSYSGSNSIDSQHKLKVKRLNQAPWEMNSREIQYGSPNKNDPIISQVKYTAPELANIQVSPDGTKFSFESGGLTYGFQSDQALGLGWAMTVGNHKAQVLRQAVWFSAKSHIADLLWADKLARYMVERTSYGGVWKGNLSGYRSPGETNSPASYPSGRFENRFAAIASCSNGTVVEIHDETISGEWIKGGKGIQPGEKPGVYEIWIMVDPDKGIHDLTMVNTLKDLAWLDSGLVGRFGNKLYLIMTNEEMESRIANSGVVKNPEIRLPMKSYVPVPTGWIWPVKPVLIETQSDSGSCEISSRVQPIGQGDFAFRNGDGTLSLCKNGQVEKTEIKVSETWAWINPKSPSIGALASTN